MIGERKTHLTFAENIKNKKHETRNSICQKSKRKSATEGIERECMSHIIIDIIRVFIANECVCFFFSLSRQLHQTVVTETGMSYAIVRIVEK